MSSTGKIKKDPFSTDNRIRKHTPYRGLLPNLNDTVWFFKDGVKVGIRSDRVEMKTNQWKLENINFVRL